MARSRKDEEDIRYTPDSPRAKGREEYLTETKPERTYELGYEEGKNAAESAAAKAAESAAAKTVQAPANPAPAALPEAAYQVANTEKKPLVSQDLLDQYLSRDKFSYDPNADPLYQMYREKYLSAGQTAMKDTLGKATALTGGYGNSYANAVAQQTYDEYAARASDKIPELYQLALDQYNQEGKDILDKYSILYGREQDQAAAEAAAAEAEEATRRWWAEFGLKADAQDFEQWLETSRLTLDQQKAAADTAYKEGQLTIDEYKAITDRIKTEGALEIDRYQAETGRINANTSSYNAQTSRMNAETNRMKANKGSNDDEEEVPDYVQTMSDAQIQSAAKTYLQEYRDAYQSEWSMQSLLDKLTKKYGEDNTAYILLAMRKLREGNPETDANITRRNPKIIAYTD